MCCEQPGEKICRATGVRRRDDADRATRISVRSLRGHHRNRQTQGDQQHGQFSTATGNTIHCLTPVVDDSDSRNSHTRVHTLEYETGTYTVLEPKNPLVVSPSFHRPRSPTL